MFDQKRAKSIYWTTLEPANNDPIPRCAEAEHDDYSCRGAIGDNPGVFPSLFVVLVFCLKGAFFVVALGFFLAMLAGCEFIYLPECDTQCQAAGGADAYGRPQ